MMKVLMLPYPKMLNGNHASGIDQVVLAYARHLPEFGIELAASESDGFDLIAAHAGLTGPVCDVAHLHGLHWTADYNAPDWEYRVNGRIVESVRHAKTITVPSEWVAETIRRDLRVDPVIIPHGIDWGDWQHGDPHSDYVLWNKNRADPWVCDPSPVYMLARRFSDQQFMTTFLPSGVGTPLNVSTLGIIPHTRMKPLIQRAGVYLATTKETWGIGILEAMAAGVPVLGYAHGGILDLVEHGVNGYLARPGDIDDLAEGLAYCLEHKAVLGANGSELARGWTWRAAVEKVAEVYLTAAETEPATVGVVIPVYNKTEQELRRAVESVVNQVEHVGQIVVVDDGSTDPNIAKGVVDSYAGGENNVSLIRQDNQGVAIARNRGIDHTNNTKYICCLDADDWLDPDFLRVCVEALEADRSLGIAYTGLYWHRPDGTHGLSQWPGKWDYDGQIERRNQIPTCCVFRREMWQRLGGYRQRYAPKGCGAEDAEFWLRAGAYGFKAAKVSDEGLFHYSWMSGQVTGDPDYKEVDWLRWHPWTRDKQHPLASYATPHRYSHPVRAYDQPAVSVIIPVGPGHEKEVANALDSLEAQTFRKWEAIVVWDSTPVADRHLAFQMAYSYVREIDTGVWSETGFINPHGAGYARNRGAEVARAPFLIFLDADDWLYPDALQKMIDAWNSQRAVVYTDFVGKAIIEPQNIKNLAPNLQRKLYNYDDRTQEAVIGYKALDFDCDRVMQQPQWPEPYVWTNVTALIPKKWHDDIGGFDESMESWEDYDYHIRHARAGHCYYHLEEELLVYRYYTGSRRDSGLQKHKNLVQYLTDKYKDGDIVGCGCRGGNKRSPSQPVAAAAVAASAGSRMANQPGRDLDFIQARLIDGKRGSHSLQIATAAVNPATGRKFDYGTHAHGDVFLVHRSDLYMTDGRTGQQILRNPGKLEPVEEQVAEPPPSAPRETPPPELLSEVYIDTSDVRNPEGEEEVYLAAIDQANFAEATRGAGIKELVTTGKEPKPYDPQTLPGINAKVAAAMLARGLDSPEAVLAAGMDGLQDVPGIGEATARKVMKYLSR